MREFISTNTMNYIYNTHEVHSYGLKPMRDFIWNKTHVEETSCNITKSQGRNFVGKGRNFLGKRRKKPVVVLVYCEFHRFYC